MAVTKSTMKTLKQFEEKSMDCIRFIRDDHLNKGDFTFTVDGEKWRLLIARK